MTSETETEAEREHTYKRGYAHGVTASISAFVHLLSQEQKATVEEWYQNVMSPWMEDAATQLKAPKFPAI